MGIVSWLRSIGLHHRLPFFAKFRAAAILARREFAERVALRDSKLRRRFVLKDRLNLRLLLDPASIVDQQIIVGNGWEREQIEKLFSYIDAFRNFGGKRYFLDIGAYWGLYSLSAHQKHWFDRIVAFEPDPLNRSQLHAQLALNFLAYEIEVRGVALSERSGTQPFQKSQSHPTGNRAGVGLLAEATSETVLVQIDRLDNQLQIQDAVLFIKIDVEGNEINVLAGAEMLMSKNQVVLQVECFPPNRPVLRSFLEKLGYRELAEIDVDLYFTNLPASAL